MSYMTHEEFQKQLKNMTASEVLTVDTEGTLTHPHSETWGLSTSAFGVAPYFGFNHKLGINLPKPWLDEIRPVIDNHPCLVFHHAKHDLRSLRNLGIRPKGKFYCTMLMAHLTDENRFSYELGPLSTSYGGEPKKMPDRMKAVVDGFGYDMVPVEWWLEYASNDALITEDLFYNLKDDFQEQGFDGELWDWEQRWIKTLLEIENAGVLINKDLAYSELKRGTQIMEEAQSDLGFNPGSPDQLSHFLIDELGLPILGKTEKGKPSTKKEYMTRYEEMLEARGDKRAKQILTYRGWSKSIGSSFRPYLEEVSPVDGRFRADFRQHKARTGRLTASRLHQIPKISIKDWNSKTKQCITTEEDRTDWEFDYSQLEFRLGSIYADEPRLIEIFNDLDRDIFTEMALDLGMSRDDTKTLNYTMMFGGGFNRISEVFNVSHTSAKAIISNYYNKYPGLLKATRFAEFRAAQNGYVKYWTRRRRHFKFKEEYRKAFNALCQGGAFEIVKRQGVRIHEAGLNNEECRMDLTVHDSYRFSIENGKEHIYIPEIQDIMEDVVSLAPTKLNKVKFKVDVKRWGTNIHYLRNAA